MSVEGKLTELPEDVMMAAKAVHDEIFGPSDYYNVLPIARAIFAERERQNAALVGILGEIQQLMKLDDRGTQGPNTRLTNALNTLVSIRNLATDAIGWREPT